MLESLRPTIESLKKQTDKIKDRNEVGMSLKINLPDNDSLVYPVSFSDSIILFSDDDSENSAIDIILNAANILSEAIKNEIPLKGAIAFGKMTIDKDKSLYFGQPLIDAYELHKELEIYGVVLHHTTQKRLEELGMGHLLTSLFLGQYLVPMKSGKISHHFINWAFMSEKPLDSVNKLYNSVSGSPRKYIDNTLEFLDWLEKEKAKREQQKKP